MAVYAGIDNFDSYSNGTIVGDNGGSGWGGAWAGGTGTVQGTTVYAGTKAVSFTQGDPEMTRAVTGVDSGDLYWAFRCDMGGNGYGYFGLRNGSGTFALLMGINVASNSIVYVDSTGSQNLLIGPTANAWYIMHISVLSATTGKVRWKISGGTFSAFTGTLTFANSVSSPSQIAGYSGNSGTAYYLDSVQTTDPEAAAGPTNVKTKDGVTQSTGIKTYESVTLANVKSVEGVT